MPITNTLRSSQFPSSRKNHPEFIRLERFEKMEKARASKGQRPLDLDGDSACNLENLRPAVFAGVSVNIPFET